MRDTMTGGRTRRSSRPGGLTHDLPFGGSVLPRVSGFALGTHGSMALRLIAMILFAGAIALVWVYEQEAGDGQFLRNGFRESWVVGGLIAFHLIGAFVTALRSRMIESGIHGGPIGIITGLPGMLKAIPMILLCVPLLVLIQHTLLFDRIILLFARYIPAVPAPYPWVIVFALFILVAYFLSMRLYFCIAAAASEECGFGQALGIGLGTGFSRLVLLLLDLLPLVALAVGVFLGWPYLETALVNSGLQGPVIMAAQGIAGLILVILAVQAMLYLPGHYWSNRLRLGKLRVTYD